MSTICTALLVIAALHTTHKMKQWLPGPLNGKEGEQMLREMCLSLWQQSNHETLNFYMKSIWIVGWMVGPYYLQQNHL